jgi:hypothetical protein
MSSLYDKGRQKHLEGSIAYLTDTIKVLPVKATYAPSLTADEFLADIVAGDRVAAAVALAAKTSTNGVADADNTTFPSVTTGLTIRYLAIYKDTGVEATSPLIALIDSMDDGAGGSTALSIPTNGGDVVIVWDADLGGGVPGIYKL